MKPYSYGNLATKIQKNTKTKVVQKKKVVHHGLSGKEKLVYFVTAIFLSSLALMIISRYADISRYNYDIISTKKEISHMMEQSNELKVQIDKLSKPERIQSIAEKMGLTRNSDTVRVFPTTPSSN